MKKIIFLLFVATSNAFAQDWSEKGSWGAIGALTDDSFKVGIQRLEQTWEAAWMGHSNYNSHKDNHVDSLFKLGLRKYIGSHNYFSYGVEYRTDILGTGTYSNKNETYNKAFKDQTLGGYIGLQRYFSGTNLMLNFWVLPVAYEVSVINSTTKEETMSYFVKGGVGVTYVF